MQQTPQKWNLVFLNKTFFFFSFIFSLYLCLNLNPNLKENVSTVTDFKTKLMPNVWGRKRERKMKGKEKQLSNLIRNSIATTVGFRKECTVFQTVIRLFWKYIQNEQQIIWKKERYGGGIFLRFQFHFYFEMKINPTISFMHSVSLLQHPGISLYRKYLYCIESACCKRLSLFIVTLVWAVFDFKHHANVFDAYVCRYKSEE